MGMGDWKKWLADFDDDYLIGIANKGIVKRAYKDKEDGNYRVLSAEEEAEVSVGGETVRIRVPLSESTCSCPSRTVCRHVVLGVLALREYGQGLSEEEGEFQEGRKEGEFQEEEKEGEFQEGEKEGEFQEEGKEGEFQEGRKEGEFQKEGKEREFQEERKEGEFQKGGKERELREGEREDGESRGCGEELPEAGKETAPAGICAGRPEKLLEEIGAYPMPSVRRALGSRQLQGIVSQVKSGQKPMIRYSSVVTVQLPEGGHTVKLLSPLEYSSCTCHKKEFCVHKAAAVLWCKLETGFLGAEELESEAGEIQEYDMGQVRGAALQMKAFLEELLDTGLARTSPDVLDYLERLALISHNAKLARFEGYWRALHDSYGSYMKRKASFSIQDLMAQQARLYQRAEMLLEAGDGEQAARLAGEFKAEYLPVGDLDLIGIADEPFESQSGYEGETIYFLEEHTKEWYTYTYARPVFYEKQGRRGKRGKTQAPWGLPVSLEDMAVSRIHLTKAKCDGRRRLSASQETKGELMGDRGRKNRLRISELGGWYYEDFGKLFQERIGRGRKRWLREQEEEGGETELVFLKAESCDKAFFSETEQKLFMGLYDGKGREVVAEVAYSKKESWGIRYLERVTEEKLPCFLGKIYLRDGKMRLYPVSVFEKGELLEDGDEE